MVVVVVVFMCLLFLDCESVQFWCSDGGGGLGGGDVGDVRIYSTHGVFSFKISFVCVII